MKSDYKKSVTVTTWKKKGSTYYIRKIKGSRYYEVCDDRLNARIYKKFISFKNADKFLQKTIKDEHDTAVRISKRFKDKIRFIRSDRESIF